MSKKIWQKKPHLIGVGYVSRYSKEYNEYKAKILAMLAFRLHERVDVESLRRLGLVSKRLSDVILPLVNSLIKSEKLCKKCCEKISDDRAPWPRTDPYHQLWPYTDSYHVMHIPQKKLDQHYTRCSGYGCRIYYPRYLEICPDECMHEDGEYRVEMEYRKNMCDGADY